jgi:hypothetical protein
MRADRMANSGSFPFSSYTVVVDVDVAAAAATVVVVVVAVVIVVAVEVVVVSGGRKGEEYSQKEISAVGLAGLNLLGKCEQKCRVVLHPHHCHFCHGDMPAVT